MGSGLRRTLHEGLPAAFGHQLVLLIVGPVTGCRPIGPLFYTHEPILQECVVNLFQNVCRWYYLLELLLSYTDVLAVQL